MIGKTFAALLLPIAALLLAGCVGPTQKVAGEKVDYTYKRFRLSWQGDGAYIDFSYTVKEMKGKVAVCGAYAESKGGRMDELTPQAVAQGIIEINGTRMVNGIEFFVDHGQADGLAGKSSGCALTEEPWKSNYSSGKGELSFPHSGYYLS